MSTETLEMPTLPGASVESGDGVKVEKSVTINRSISEAYSFWRELENLPQFAKHLLSVTPSNETDSHWVARTPKGKKVEWDAHIIDEKRDELIAWQSLPGGGLSSAGSVRFRAAASGRGTVVSVSMKYAPNDGKMGKLFAKYFNRDGKKEIAQTLFNFKSLLETGEIPTTSSQPKGHYKSGEKAP